MNPPIASATPAARPADSSSGGGWGSLLLGVALVSMVGLLWPALHAGPLALDEHVSYWMIDSEQPASLWERSLDVGAVPPLSFVPQRWMIALFGPREWALRLPSLLFAWGTLPVMFLLGRKLGGGVCGGVAALLLAWHPDLLDEVRIGRCYGQVVCLAALLMLVTLWWRERFHAWGRSGIWAATAAAILWTHYTAALIVAMCALWLVVEAIRSADQKVALVRIVLAAGLVLAMIWPLWGPAERLREWGPLLNMHAPESPFWQTVTPFWWLALPLGVFTAGLIGRLAKSTPGVHTHGTKPPWQTEGQLLLLGSLVPLLVIALVAVGDLSSLANPRYRVAYTPAGAVWVAWLLTRLARGPRVIAAAAIVLAAAWSAEPLRPWQLGRLGSPADRDWQAISETLREQASDGEPILVQSGLVESSLVPALANDPLFLEYVACRVSRFSVPQPHPRWGLPYFWDDATQAAFTTLIETSSARRIWIAGATDTDLSRGSLEGARQVALDAGFQVKSEQAFPNALLIELTR